MRLIIDNKKKIIQKIQNAVYNDESIKVVQYNNVVDLSNYSIKEQKKIVKVFLMETFKNAKIKTIDGKNIGITSTGGAKKLSEFLSKHAVALYSDDLVQIGTPSGTSKDDANRNIIWHYYDSYINIDGETFYAKINIQQDNNGFVLHEINGIKKISILPALTVQGNSISSKNNIASNKNKVNTLTADEYKNNYDKENKLIKLSSSLIKNINESKSSIYSYSKDDIISQCKKVIKDKNYKKNNIVGIVPQSVANKIKKDTNIDVSNSLISIPFGELRHWYDRHVLNTASQIKMNLDDILLYSYVILNYDEVEKTTHKGQQSLIFRKKIDDNTYLTSNVVSITKKKISFGDFYIGTKKSRDTYKAIDV